MGGLRDIEKPPSDPDPIRCPDCGHTVRYHIESGGCIIAGCNCRKSRAKLGIE